MCRKLFFSLALAMCCAVSADAAGFMDTGTPTRLISVGARLGITSSNLSTDIPGYADNGNFSWKRGFAAGVVVDLHVRNYFSIQPGFFFENRSYDYTLISHYPEDHALTNQLGHTRRYAFTVPIMAAFHFNLTSNLQWLVEAGPYFAFGTGDGKDEVEQIHISAPEGASGSYIYNTAKRDYYGDGDWQHRSFDCGLQIGTGIRILDRYVLSVHFQRGLRNVSANHSQNWEMHNKGWTFAIGYDF